MQSSKLQSPAGLLVIAALTYGAMELMIKLLPRLTEPSVGLVVYREAVLLGVTIAIFAFLVRRKTIDPALMGAKRLGGRTLAWGVFCGIASVVVSAVMILAMLKLGVVQNSSVLGALASKPVWLLLLMSLTAAVSEEIVFRGVILSHVASATGRTWLGAVVSLVLFAAAHFTGWGWSQVLFAAVPGAVLTLFFVWKRDLGICIIGHFLTDVIGLLAAAAQVHNL